MTALYIIGGAICAAMSLGLIYFIVVDPIRLYLQNASSGQSSHGSLLAPLNRHRLAGVAVAIEPTTRPRLAGIHQLYGSAEHRGLRIIPSPRAP